jgi:hypothetical protein
MKQIKLFFQILATTALFAISSSVSAQGEWKWANYWSGSGGSYNNVFNEVANTAFDEEGNVYVYGTIGGSPVFNGDLLPFSGPIEVTATNAQGIMLAKFDTLGNMLWFKLVKCSNNGGMVSEPHWMEIRENRIYISGSTGLWGFQSYGTWVYYMDTLIRQTQVESIPVAERKPPFKDSQWTFFAKLDQDGNVLEDHFVEAYSRETEISGSFFVRGITPLCMERNAPIHVDGNGNTYVYTYLEYKGNEEDPYTIVVDGDTNKTYDIYLPGTWQQGATMPYLYNAMIYKFSPNWDLVYAKRIVDHTEGIATSWEYLRDSINPSFVLHPTGLSSDENDNMYLSGYLTISMHNYGNGGQLHQYPIHVFWDNECYATINDMSGANRINFVIKYDTTNNIQWCNQIYTKGHPTNFEQLSHGELYGNCYHNNSMYVTGRGCSALDENVGIFFDSTCTIRLHGPQDIDRTNVGFFVRYDATTGSYVNHGVVPVIEGNSSATPGPVPAVINDRVFALSLYKQYSWDPAIIQWSTDGDFISHIPFSTGQSKLGAVNANQNGKLLVDFAAFSPVTFSDDVVAECDNPGRSHAVFALYHDPSFAEPYVGINHYVEDVASIKVWPNPTSNILYVESDSSPIECITIMDLNGRIIMKEKVGDNSFVVNAARLPAGLYLLETVCKGARTVEKFVKVDD